MSLQHGLEDVEETSNFHRLLLLHLLNKGRMLVNVSKKFIVDLKFRKISLEFDNILFFMCRNHRGFYFLSFFSVALQRAILI